MSDKTESGDDGPLLHDSNDAIAPETPKGAGPGPGPIRIYDLLVLTALLFPAALAVELWGWNGPGGAAALAWLFPVGQLIHARLSIASYRAFVGRYLPGDRFRSTPGRRLYSSGMIDAAWSRISLRVIGAAPVKRGAGPRAVATRMIGAGVPSEFDGPAHEPIVVDSPPRPMVGTAETLFLTPLLYLNVLVLEYYRRRFNYDESTLSGKPCPSGTNSDRESDQPMPLLRLDRYLRRAGEWFRRKLNADDFHSEIFGEASLYFSYRVERLRHLLGKVPTCREGELRAEDMVEIEAELKDLGVTDPEQVTESTLDAAVSNYVREYHIKAVDPQLLDLASFAPRLIAVLVLTAFSYARDSISPIDMLVSSFAGGLLPWLGFAGVFAGALGLWISACSHSPDLFLRRDVELHGFVQSARSRGARIGIMAALLVGVCGCLELAPGLDRGMPDLSGLMLPLIGAGFLAMEVIALACKQVSFAGVVWAYHFRPTTVLGSPRLVAFSLAQYVLFVGLGTWVGMTVGTYLEGQLLATWTAPRPWEPGYPWKLQGVWTAVLLLAFVAIARRTGPMARSTLAPGLALVLAIPFLISYRPLGGFIIGVAALIIVLYLGNQAIFNIAIGLTAVLKEIGRPRRLAWLAPVVVLLGSITGGLGGWGLGPSLPETPRDGVALLLDLFFGISAIALVAGLVEPYLGTVVVMLALGGFVSNEWSGAETCRHALIGLVVLGSIVRLYRSSRGKRPAVDADRTPADGSLAILWTARNPIASPALLAGPAEATRRYLELWDAVIAPNDFRSTRALLAPDGSPLGRDAIARALAYTFEVEKSRRRTLFGEEAIVVRDEPMTEVQERLRDAVDESGDSLNLLCTVEEREEAELLRLGLRLQRYLVTRVPIEASGRYTPLRESQRDTMYFAVDLAYSLEAAGLSRAAVLYIQSNKGASRLKDLGERWPNDPSPFEVFGETSLWAVEFDERLALAAYLGAVAGLRAEVVHTHTFDACKGSAQNGNSGTFRHVGAAYVLDRNTQSFTLREVVDDIRRLFDEPDLAGILPARSTPNTVFPVGSQADQGEFGYSMFAEALINDLGGERGEMIATGWGNLIALPLNELITLFADPAVPCRFDPSRCVEARHFGAIHGMLNAPLVSEDYVQIIGTAEGLKSLGRTPRLATSRSFHYKLREHSTTLEFLTARPRWAGGGDPGQKGRDPLLQRLRELGTDSIFMRELQRDRGRYYALAPIAMAFILMTPILVMTGYSPFVGISVLFVIGISSNQALTLNSLAAWLRRAGLLGGAAIWLSQRVRDVILFPPLAFIEMWGVMESIRRGSKYPFIFQTSGGARMENYGATVARTMVKDKNSSRLMRYMVMTGLLGTAVNVFSILGLDLLNVLMLYPTLIFTLGLTIGAFVYQRQRGPGLSPLGVLRWGPKVLGAAIGAIVVVAFALGTGVAREPAGPLTAGMLLVPSHLQLLMLCFFIINALLDAFGPRDASPGSRHRSARMLLGSGLGALTALAALVVFAGGIDVLPALGLRGHILLLSLCSATVFTAIPLRTSLAPPDPGSGEVAHNLLIVTCWVTALFGVCAAVGSEPGPMRERVAAVAAVGAVGFIRLVPTFVLAMIRGWRNANGEPSLPRRINRTLARGWGHVVREPELNWTRETIARSTLITVAALIWFALVPVPAFVSFQVFQYKATLQAERLGVYIPVLITSVGFVLVAGWISITLAWVILTRRHRRLHLLFHRKARDRAVVPTMAAMIEAAFEGYRVAADTRSPVLASAYLEAVERALEYAGSPELYFGSDGASNPCRAHTISAVARGPGLPAEMQVIVS